ncbi:MAG: metallophosphoesterase, partial [Candidatus Roizmanbacteria bacterium]|nr:metallophosphoesterase [Candidatus Roizmanbacteria bacterium]
MKFFRRILVLSFLVISAVLVLNQYLPKEQSSNIVLTKPVITDKPISFAVISDIHSDYLNLEKVLAKIKDDNMEFVIVAGDLTTVGGLKELEKVKDILDKSNLTYYVIPGNHDYYQKTKLTNYYQEVYRSSYESFQINKTRFILIDNASSVDQTQSDWID